MTLIELVISMTVFVMVITVISGTYANFTSSKRRVLLTNELHNETAFLLERMAREIHNGTIDYQAYWKENLFNRTAQHWAHNNGEAASPMGAKISPNDDMFSDLTTPGLNSYKNCSTSTLNATTDSGSDTDSLKKRNNIIYNYRYQFIYPGHTWTNNGNGFTDNSLNTKGVHLNCVNDNVNTATDYNVYDDETAYGSGPRAFNEDSSITYDSSVNIAQASEMLWDWDLTTIDPKIDNNPPLLLVKANSDKTEYTRSAIRYEHNKIKLIRFTGKDTDTTPPDFIADYWTCAKDFECKESYDGFYIWSQKETRSDSSENGIGTITDTNLGWTDITPEKIEIIDFDFILSPVKDPHKAFAEKEHIQKPQVTLILTAQAKRGFMKGIKGNPPKIQIQTTVTPRVWDQVEVDN